jgi:hypothetical protein
MEIGRHLNLLNWYTYKLSFSENYLLYLSIIEIYLLSKYIINYLNDMSLYNFFIIQNFLSVFIYLFIIYYCRILWLCY